MAEGRVTDAGQYIEIEGQLVRVTDMGGYFEIHAVVGRVSSLGLYTEIVRAQGRSTAVGLYVEIEYVQPPLRASLVSLLRVQAGRQDAFDSPAAMAVAIPAVGDAQDAQEEHVAPWDQGAWTPIVIVDKVAQIATFELNGTLFFETLPLLLEPGFGAMLPSGDGPYTFEGGATPGIVSDPVPYTYRFGGDNAGVVTGSMVQVQDAYLQSLHLEFGLDAKAILYKATFFGRFYDDNGGLGYQPASVTLPPNLGLVNGLLATMAVQDAGSTGGAFDDLASLDCELMGWSIDLETGLRPMWAGDRNALTYCGVRHEAPLGRFQPVIRTNIATYATVLVKAQQRAYQELELAFYGADSRQAVLHFTGRWLSKLQGHERERGEIVMKPTFIFETPHTQTTTPHWATWAVDSAWEGLA